MYKQTLQHRVKVGFCTAVRRFAAQEAQIQCGLQPAAAFPCRSIASSAAEATIKKETVAAHHRALLLMYVCVVGLFAPFLLSALGTHERHPKKKKKEREEDKEGW